MATYSGLFFMVALWKIGCEHLQEKSLIVSIFSYHRCFFVCLGNFLS